MLCAGTPEAIQLNAVILTLCEVQYLLCDLVAPGRGMFSQLDSSVKVHSNVVSWLRKKPLSSMTH